MVDTQLPEMIFRLGNEPSIDNKVNVYFMLKYLQVVVNTIEDDHMTKIMNSQFGKLLEAGNKIAFSVRFIHYLLCRQLVTKKKHEIWVLFAGQPIRFSLKEFCIATGLNCREIPSSSDGDENGLRKYMEYLFGDETNPTPLWIVKRLVGRPYKDKETRMRLCCLLLVDGVVCATSKNARINEKHILMVRDVDKFLNYPWGRESFDMTINSIKGRSTASKLAQKSSAIQGFAHGLELVVLACAPSIMNKEVNAHMLLDEPEEMDEEESGPILGKAGQKPITISMRYVRFLNKEHKVNVAPTIDFCRDDVSEKDLSWNDEVDDERVAHLMDLIKQGQVFSYKSWTGGAIASEHYKSKKVPEGPALVDQQAVNVEEVVELTTSIFYEKINTGNAKLLKQITEMFQNIRDDIDDKLRKFKEDFNEKEVSEPRESGSKDSEAGEECEEGESSGKEDGEEEENGDEVNEGEDNGEEGDEGDNVAERCIQVTPSSESRVRATAKDMDAAVIVEEEEDEKECEDWCFVCKDGGSLMLCDYKDCPKVYHASCVEKDISVRENEESLICKWHSCYLCSKRPKLCCLCCPHAVCEGCVTHAEFIHLKENKGLCNQCQEYVFALEEIQEYDAAGDKIDLTDRDTFECLFLEYWEIVKCQEDITFDDVRASKSRKKGVKLRYKDDPEFSLDDAHTSKSQKKGVKLKCKDDPKFSLSDHAVKDAEDYKTMGKTKRMEFIRWGSKPLIDFLTSIGEDTRDAMSQHSVESVIRRYIRQKNLIDREKKKKVCCDEKLYSIFRKKSVNQNKIYTLLNAHLKENLEQLEYITGLECGFSETNEKVLVPCKKQKTERSDEKMKPEMRSTGFATINADNIKLVYLRKSLVVELLKQNDNFGDKVVGSFVKVKNDPRDCMAYQILQVTGIKTADEQGMFLYVAGMASDVSISKLDDSDISKEDIENLKQKVISGLLRQPTVVEMEQKAKALHEDITKHWIARQLIILQKRINYANEKGWRKELDEYLEQRELLQKPLEQERLLRETPRIIEDLIEIKQEPAASSDSSKQGNTSSLTHEAVIDID